ncbi:MAG: hypothetical protein LC780_15155, partial [Acidobacteria bacterium]|nr:hypothetical protein [Acidobacteriota bacterium]
MSLEFDIVLRLISSLARTEPGRGAVSGLVPSGDETSVRALLSETSEVWSFRIRHGRLPLADVEEIEGPLATIESGAFGGGGGRPLARRRPEVFHRAHRGSGFQLAAREP